MGLVWGMTLDWQASDERWYGIAVGAGSAALAGAMLSSAVGPIGAAVGAAVSAIAGFIISELFGHKKRKQNKSIKMIQMRQWREQVKRRYYDQQYAVI